MLAVITAFIAGLQKKPPTGVSKLSVLAQSFTIPQLITALTGIQQVFMAVATAKQSFHKAVLAAEAEAISQKAFIDAVRKALIYVYGTDTEGLEGCGITEAKPRAPRTVQQKAVAVARATETRNANKPPVKPTPKVTVTDVDGTTIGGTEPAAPASNTTAAAPAAAGSTPVAGH
jgi:hypothetical protein